MSYTTMTRLPRILAKLGDMLVQATRSLALELVLRRTRVKFTRDDALVRPDSLTLGKHVYQLLLLAGREVIPGPQLIANAAADPAVCENPSPPAYESAIDDLLTEKAH